MEFLRQKINPENLPAVIRTKWRGMILEEGVVPLSKMALRTFSKLFQGNTAVEQLQVMLALIDYRGTPSPILPSRDLLAFIAGLDVKTFNQRVAELESLGLLAMEDVKDRVSYNYDGYLAAVKELIAGVRP